MSGYISKGNGREQFVIRTTRDAIDKLDLFGAAINGGKKMPRGQAIEDLIERVIIINDAEVDGYE